MVLPRFGTIQAFLDLRCQCKDPKEKQQKQKPCKSRLLSGTKGKANRIELKTGKLKTAKIETADIEECQYKTKVSIQFF